MNTAEVVVHEVERQRVAMVVHRESEDILLRSSVCYLAASWMIPSDFANSVK